MENSTEALVRASITRYVAAVAASDHADAEHARAVVAELCMDAVAKAAVAVVKPADTDVDDVVATAQLVFFEVLPDHLAKFDTAKVVTLQSGRKGTFAGWVLYGCSAWSNQLRRELERSSGLAGINTADQQMQRIYHGCRERFVALHGRDWSSAEAHTHVSGYLHETTAARYAAKHPDWDEDTLQEATRNRIRKDGHLRTLRELDEVVRLQDAARAASLDAPVGPDSELTLGASLAGELVVDEPDDTFSDWARVATLGMGRADARMVADHFDDPDRQVPVALLEAARANLVDPLAQFVVLGGVGAQFEPEHVPAASSTLAARELLVAAANLA